MSIRTLSRTLSGGTLHVVDKPYFMSNKGWYMYDFERMQYVLTPEAPEIAKKSYETWMIEVENES